MPQANLKSSYFRCGLPYNRAGHGPKPLVIFQGLMFENKPQPGMTFGYGFLEKDSTLYAVLRKPGLPQGYTLKDMADDYAGMIRQEFSRPVDVGKPPDLSDLAITVEAEDQHAFKERLSEISAPTLVIAGLDDPFYSPAFFRLVRGGMTA